MINKNIFWILFNLTLSIAAQAKNVEYKSTHTIQSCEEAGVDLRSVVAPVKSNVIDLVQGPVTFYKIDQIEPAAASFGIAVVLPKFLEDNEVPFDVTDCLFIGGFGDVNFKKATVKPGTGANVGYTVVKFPVSYNDPETGKKSYSSITLRVLQGEEESKLEIIK